MSPECRHQGGHTILWLLAEPAECSSSIALDRDIGIRQCLYQPRYNPSILFTQMTERVCCRYFQLILLIQDAK